MICFGKGVIQIGLTSLSLDKFRFKHLFTQQIQWVTLVENRSNMLIKKKSKKERRGLCLSDSRRAEVTNLRLIYDTIQLIKWT